MRVILIAFAISAALVHAMDPPKPDKSTPDKPKQDQTNREQTESYIKAGGAMFSSGVIKPKPQEGRNPEASLFTNALSVVDARPKLEEGERADLIRNTKFHATTEPRVDDVAEKEGVTGKLEIKANAGEVLTNTDGSTKIAPDWHADFRINNMEGITPGQEQRIYNRVAKTAIVAKGVQESNELGAAIEGGEDPAKVADDMGLEDKLKGTSRTVEERKNKEKAEQAKREADARKAAKAKEKAQKRADKQKADAQAADPASETEASKGKGKGKVVAETETKPGGGSPGGSDHPAPPASRSGAAGPSRAGCKRDGTFCLIGNPPKPTTATSAAGATKGKAVGTPVQNAARPTLTAKKVASAPAQKATTAAAAAKKVTSARAPVQNAAKPTPTAKQAASVPVLKVTKAAAKHVRRSLTMNRPRMVYEALQEFKRSLGELD